VRSVSQWRSGASDPSSYRAFWAGLHPYREVLCDPGVRPSRIRGTTAVRERPFTIGASLGRFASRPCAGALDWPRLVEGMQIATLVGLPRSPSGLGRS